MLPVKYKFDHVKTHSITIWAQLSVTMSEEDFSMISMHFEYLLIIFHLKRMFFIWKNLNIKSFHPKMHCAKLNWNWPNCSREEDENVKSLRTDGRQTSDNQKIKGHAHLWEQVIVKWQTFSCRGFFNKTYHKPLWLKDIIMLNGGPCPFQRRDKMGSENKFKTSASTSPLVKAPNVFIW